MPQTGPEALKRAEQLARAVQFAQRAQNETDSFEDMAMLLTNDARALTPFDRAFLITYIGGTPSLFSATGQTEPQTKSKLAEKIVETVDYLRNLEKILIISSRGKPVQIQAPGLEAEALDKINAYCEFSDCRHLALVPLRRVNSTIGLIVLEFLEDQPPDTGRIMALGAVAPFLAVSLTEKWLAQACPKAADNLYIPAATTRRNALLRSRKLPYALAAVAILLGLLFLAPVSFHVGGEVELIPTHRRVAFIKNGGLIEKVAVREGQTVKQGQILATLDPRDLEFEINKAKRELEILTREMELLRHSAGDDNSKFAESQLVQLRRANKLRELEFLESKRKYLQITAPVTGAIVTKNVESLTGKSFKAGEPFCEIAEKGRISAQVSVPEERIGYVTKGLPMFVRLNTAPTNVIELKVEEIAPRSEATRRWGNVFTVRSRISDPPGDLRVGMKGVGKIDVGERTPWFIIKQRLLAKWNQLTLYF
jgi:RND family efflux transporter MFP subunit